MTVHVSEVVDGAGVTQVLPASRRSLFRPYRDVMKRQLDIVAVLLMALVAAPVIAVFSLLLMSQGQKPFYIQTRVGRNGRTFRMVKMQTMVANADIALADYLASNPAARAEWDSTQKLKNDPRITPLGRMLRKTSLDELPQLWNVLVGDMSLVGPRPMMDDQRSLYRGQAYYRVRPGITGLWQISDRNECDFVQRAVFDETYVRNISFLTDTRILMHTVSVVFRCTGY